MPLRCLFVVQGEGRGHLTQALALRRLLVAAGHRVEAAVVGRSLRRTVPAFFEEKIEAPVTFIDSPSFVPDAEDRSVRPWMSIMHEAGRTPAFLRSLDTIGSVIERHDPDVVVNFFEPLMGVYALRQHPSVPVVAVAHQYMFLHRTYRFPPGRWLQRQAVQAFARVTARGASRCLALSLYPVPDDSSTGPTVLPPLLRPKVFRQPTDEEGSFYLVYVLNSGYADEITEWHKQNPDVSLHCFWDRPDVAPVEQYDETLTFHRLDDRKFLSLMAQARGLVTTAGFESVAEAMYLDTPVQVVPVEGHFEQHCNAFDAVRAGAGIRSSDFDIDRLRAYQSADATDAARFRRWVQRGRAQFVREIEAAAVGPDASDPAPRASAGCQRLEIA